MLEMSKRLLSISFNTLSTILYISNNLPSLSYIPSDLEMETVSCIHNDPLFYFFLLGSHNR